MDFNVLERELTRNVHDMARALCMEGRTAQPKTQKVDCRKCFVKGHYAAMCCSKKTLRRLEEEKDVILLVS